MAKKFAITPFLLEKSRVVNQCSRERNYHIFYQLVKCADSSLKTELKIRPISWYKYLTHGDESADRVDDSGDWKAVCEAIGKVGIPKRHWNYYMRCVSAVLLLGNITWDKKGDGVTLSSEGSLLVDEICELLNASGMADRVKKLLCFKIIQSRDGDIEKPYNESDAKVVADSLARGLYERTFLHIIDEMNALSKRQSDNPNKQFGSASVDFSKFDPNTKFIALLDIFGFEDLNPNSLEQMLINLTNESLQQFFFGAIFDHQKKLLDEEGVKDQPDLSYQGNKDQVDALNKLLGQLGDQCSSGQLKPETFYKSVLNINPAIISRTLGVSQDEFTVAHSVKKVSYDPSEFGQRNVDILSGYFVQMFKEQTDSYISKMYADIPAVIGKLPKGAFIADQYKASLTSLLSILSNSECAFVRCIRPNDEKKKLTYVPSAAERQLQALSIVESVNALSKGFPVVKEFNEFTKVYYIGEGLSEATALLNKVLGEPGRTTYAIGKSKIFISHTGAEKLSNDLSERTHSLEQVVLILEGAWFQKRYVEDMYGLYEQPLSRVVARSRAAITSKPS